MARVENWPVVPSPNITLGNIDSSVAVATLWTDQKRIVQELNPDDYAIVGNLYTRDEGISKALRNLLTNTGIRHLIVCGTDKMGSGQALVNLWDPDKGIDDNHKIIGSGKTVLHKELPISAVRRATQNIKLYDLRQINPDAVGSELRSLVPVLEKLPDWGEPEFYPIEKHTLVEMLPSEDVHVLRGRTVGETWLKIVNDVLRFGEAKITNYGNMATDASNTVAVVTDEDPNNPKIEDYFNFTKEDVGKYVQEFLNPECPPGVFYTYGERIFAHGPHKINQAEIMIRKLQQDPNDRGAVAILYDPYHDNQLDIETPVKDFRNPCIVFLQSSIKNEKLELSAFFRSNDMFGAWPLNAFGLRAFQSWMGSRLGRDLGSLYTISMRAHMYDDIWPKVQETLDNYGHKLRKINLDPRGGFAINVNENGNILLNHIDEEGTPLGPEISFEGKDRRRASVAIEHYLTKEGMLSTSEHGLYIGRELVLAEIAAKAKLPYTQDRNTIVENIVEMAKKAQEYDRLKEQGII